MGRELTNDADVQVDRYKREWLEWSSRMNDQTFLRDLIWKIDDPTINVYPKNWASCRETHPSRASTDRIRTLIRALRNPKKSVKHGDREDSRKRRMRLMQQVCSMSDQGQGSLQSLDKIL